MISFKRNSYAAAVFGCILTLLAAGCGNGAGNAVATTGSNVVGGVANKGPFQKGATVTAYKLDAAGNRTTTTATTTVTDNLGTYSLTGISWSGATEVVITGKYYNENTGAVSTTNESLSAFTVLPAVGTAVNNVTTNPNVASDAAAKLAKKTLATASATGTTVDPAAAISSANNTVLQSLGLPSSDANGNPIDTAKLDLTKTSDATLGTANAQLLVMSAALLDTTTTAGSTVDALINSLVTDIQNGDPLGTSDAAITPATINTSISTAKTNAATIASNINTQVKNVTGTTGTVTTTQVTTAATSTQTNVTTTLKGYALSGNTFTVGTVAGGSTVATYTLASNGNATTAGGSILKNNVVVKGTFKDYTNATGSGAGTATTNSTTLEFYIASTTDTRKVSGSITPVTVTTDGAGKVSVVVPASAVLTFSGTDSLGAVVSGTATNIAANTIQATASALSIDANALLTTIQNKTAKASLNVLSTAGTYNFEFSLGLNIGHENAGATGIDKLFTTGATGAKVGGRRIFGTITTL